VKARLAPVVLYVFVAALAAPGALLASEEGQPGADPQAGNGTPPVEGAEPPAAPAAEPPAQPAGCASEPAPASAEAAPPAPAEQPRPPAEPGAKQAPVARAAAPGSVTIKDFSFAPKSITVSVGETVTWTNQGPAPHSATADDGSFDTGNFPRGQSRSHKFTRAGTFSYYCKPHPFMKATVRVTSAGGGGGGESDAGGGSGDSGTGSSGGGSAGSTAGSSAGGRDRGSDLPATGADPGSLAALGAGLLALGLLTRRRATG
jgi:LPXTG-motif cell wall-anchored protein